MAQTITQDYKPAYTDEELQFDLFRGSFANEQHPVFAVYDEVMDQLIVRLVEPSVFASEYYVTDEIALLVRDTDRAVVGFTVSDFQSAFLPLVPNLNELWIKHKLAEHLRKYVTGTYEPKPQKQRAAKTEQRIFKYSAYKSKAAAEAVLVIA
jgi:hypothetical protein